MVGQLSQNPLNHRLESLLRQLEGGTEDGIGMGRAADGAMGPFQKEPAGTLWYVSVQCHVCCVPVRHVTTV